MAAIDRRFTKSEEAIRTNLIKLLQRKKLRDINLNELTDAADINRSTFYLHYESIDDAFSGLEDLFVTTWQRISIETAPTLGSRLLLTFNADRKLGTAVLLNCGLELVEKLFGAYRSVSSFYPEIDELSLFALLGSGISVLGRWARGKCKVREEKVAVLLEKGV